MPHKTNVPGLAALHKVVSDDCRQRSGGEDGVRQEVLTAVNLELQSLMNSWEVGQEALIHIAITVEPGKPKPPEPV